jgi:small subunit ribosomal protein S18
MGKKLFISNLEFEVSQDQLQQMIAEIGQIQQLTLALDRETRRSRGFAFAEMVNDDEAQKVIDALNGKTINGRPIKVVFDRGKNAPRDTEASGGDLPSKREILPPVQRAQLFRRKKKLDPFMVDPSKVIDYKESALLSKFVSERGKILSRRFTGLTAYNQRKVSKAIKRAQHLGYLAFTNVAR